MTRQKAISILTVLAVLAVLAVSGAVAHARDPQMDWVLAASWTPAFCETVKHGPKECRTISDTAFAARNFSLHGLWPAKSNYCDITEKQKSLDKNRRWGELPETILPAPLARELSAKMPGRQSRLDRHEWIKHGSCSTLDQADYFRLSLRLVDRLNGGSTAQLIRNSVNRPVTRKQICNALIRDFGKRAPSAVRLKTRKTGNRSLLVEMQFRLRTGPDRILNLAAEDLRPGKGLKCDSHTVFIDAIDP